MAAAFQPEAYRFFRELGNRPAYARSLAVAERWAGEHRVRAEWTDDREGDLGDHEYWCQYARHLLDCYDSRACEQYGTEWYHGHRHEVLQVVVRYGVHLAALGGIIEPDRHYRRQIEAELYDELRDQVFEELAAESASGAA